MNLNLAGHWSKIAGTLGNFAGFIPGIANSVGAKISEADGLKIEARADEAIEAADALKAAAVEMKAAVQPDADGVRRLTIAEGGSLLLAAEDVVDEFEDVYTGKDEDDQPETTPGG